MDAEMGVGGGTELEVMVCVSLCDGKLRDQLSKG
jgi:hypothetical protein